MIIQKENEDIASAFFWNTEWGFLLRDTYFEPDREVAVGFKTCVYRFEHSGQEIELIVPIQFYPVEFESTGDTLRIDMNSVKRNGRKTIPWVEFPRLEDVLYSITFNYLTIGCYVQNYNLLHTHPVFKKGGLYSHDDEDTSDEHRGILFPLNGGQRTPYVSPLFYYNDPKFTGHLVNNRIFHVSDNLETNDVIYERITRSFIVYPKEYSDAGFMYESWRVKNQDIDNMQIMKKVAKALLPYEPLFVKEMQ